MLQGDAYGIPIEIRNEEGIVTPADVSDVEITVSFYQKKYSAGQIRYDEDDNVWIVYLSQEETFRLRPLKVGIQLRVKWLDGSVEGVDLGYQRIGESYSKEVL